MSIEIMKKQLLNWYPWWNLEGKSPRQIACIYQNELHLEEEKARKRYMKVFSNTEDEDMQAEIWLAYTDRFKL